MMKGTHKQTVCVFNLLNNTHQIISGLERHSLLLEIEDIHYDYVFISALW